MLPDAWCMALQGSCMACLSPSLALDKVAGHVVVCGLPSNMEFFLTSFVARGSRGLVRLRILRPYTICTTNSDTFLLIMQRF